MCTARDDVLRALPTPVGAGTAAEQIPLQPVDALTITTLVDNVADLTLPDEGPATRAALSGPTVAARLLDGGRAPDVLRAEHGFSVLVTVTQGPRTRRVLFDAGITPDGMVDNMRRLDLDPREIDVVVLSHGHFDHTTGLDGLVRVLGRPNLPVLVHPDVWTRRRLAIPGRDLIELPPPSRRALLGAGFEVVDRPEPSLLLDGALLVTGEVDRTTDHETGFAGHVAERRGRWVPDPRISDDQGLVAHVRGRGLVVLTGCGHAGVVNLLRYARRLTGVEQVHAVLGGFHLAGVAFAPLIRPTVAALVDLRPEVVVPAHCTGWPAARAIDEALPGALVRNSVGTVVTLAAA